MIRFERQSSLLAPMRPQRIPLRINRLLDARADALGGNSATSWVAALLDFVGHARKMFADRPQRRFRF
jgi:hypothetical protein